MHTCGPLRRPPASHTLGSHQEGLRAASDLSAVTATAWALSAVSATLITAEAPPAVGLAAPPACRHRTSAWPTNRSVHPCRNRAFRLRRGRANGEVRRRPGRSGRLRPSARLSGWPSSCHRGQSSAGAAGDVPGEGRVPQGVQHGRFLKSGVCGVQMAAGAAVESPAAGSSALRRRGISNATAAARATAPAPVQRAGMSPSTNWWRIRSRPGRRRPRPGWRRRWRRRPRGWRCWRRMRCPVPRGGRCS